MMPRTTEVMQALIVLTMIVATLSLFADQKTSMSLIIVSNIVLFLLIVAVFVSLLKRVWGRL